MEKEKKSELPMCEMCGDEWVYELDNDVDERKKNYKNIKKNKRCVSCCNEFGKN
jgi:transposase